MSASYRGPGFTSQLRNHSQAIAIDVFGTLKTSSGRDRILDAIAERFGVASGGPWAITLEWMDTDRLLGEPRPTFTRRREAWVIGKGCQGGFLKGCGACLWLPPARHCASTGRRLP